MHLHLWCTNPYGNYVISALSLEIFLKHHQHETKSFLLFVVFYVILRAFRIYQGYFEMAF